MKTINSDYASLEDLRENLDLSSMDISKTFIQVFSGLFHKEELEELVSILKEKNANIKFIGTTTAGEIFDAQTATSSILISMTEFEDTRFQTAHFSNADHYQLGVDIASSLFKDDTKAMILFIEGMAINGNDVVDGIGSVNNSIPIAGGMAGDNGNFIKTFVFDNNGVYEDGAVCVALNSEVLNVFTNYQLNWQPIGKFMTVTKAEKNRLYEIDGIPAAQIYRKYLGDKVGDGLPHSAIEFPMLKIEDDGLEVCRTFVHKFDEDDSLLTIGNLEVGDQIRLAFGNVDLIVKNAANDVQEYKDFNPEAIFTYSCASRITFLQSDVVTELEPLNNIAPIAGFFTYGEIYHHNGKNSLLNISLTILGLSENRETKKSVVINDEIKKEEKNFFTDKHFVVLDALTNLSNRVIEELDESKAVVEKAHKSIKDSINFASLIQGAILPDTQSILPKYMNDFFFYWQPKDVVGGDIYFLIELEETQEIIIMVFDGAGHGVPGAFVTMLVKAIEAHIVAELKTKTLTPDPAELLSYFNVAIKTMLKQEKGSKSNAGFDGGIVYYNKSTKVCKYAGAKTDLYLVNGTKLDLIRGDKKNVGFVRTKIDQKYTNHEVLLQKDTRLYISTDGLFDQKGANKVRYGTDRFASMLLEVSSKPFSEHETLLKESLTEFQKDTKQVDDITIVGLNFKG